MLFLPIKYNPLFILLLLQASKTQRLAKKRKGGNSSFFMLVFVSESQVQSRAELLTSQVIIRTGWFVCPIDGVQSVEQPTAHSGFIGDSCNFSKITLYFSLIIF